jgi:hypothetical protein
MLCLGAESTSESPGAEAAANRPSAQGIHPRDGRLSYCPRYRHKPPLLDHMPPAFAHCCSAEGSEPGCETIAQPATIENTQSRVSIVPE